jgi:hypothetical protein
MSEIDVTKINNQKTSNVGVTSETFMGSQGSESKWRIAGEVRGKTRSRQVRLIERAFDGAASSYSEKWKQCKDAQLPVVPTLRLTDRDSVVLTDVTADGSQLFGKGLNLDLQMSDDFQRSRLFNLYNIPLFRKIYSENREKIEKELLMYSRFAWAKGILLPGDDSFELLIKPDGNWQLLLLDLTQIEYAPRDDLLLKGNERSVNKALKFLDGIYEKTTPYFSE